MNEIQKVWILRTTCKYPMIWGNRLLVFSSKEKAEKVMKEHDPDSWFCTIEEKEII